jgi:hypothetical protein
MTRWGKAGQRLTPDEAHARDATARTRRNQARAVREVAAVPPAGRG